MNWCSGATSPARQQAAPSPGVSSVVTLHFHLRDLMVGPRSEQVPGPGVNRIHEAPARCQPHKGLRLKSRFIIIQKIIFRYHLCRRTARKDDRFFPSLSAPVTALFTGLQVHGRRRATAPLVGDAAEKVVDICTNACVPACPSGRSLRAYGERRR